MIQNVIWIRAFLLVKLVCLFLISNLSGQPIFKGVVDVHNACGARSADGNYIVAVPFGSGSLAFLVLDSAGDLMNTVAHPIVSWPVAPSSGSRSREPLEIIALPDTSVITLYFDENIRCYGLMRFKPGNGITYDIQIDTAKTHFPSAFSNENSEKMLLDTNGDLLVLLPLDVSILSTSKTAHFALCRFNPGTGTLISSLCYGGLKTDIPANMIHTQDGGLLLVGSTTQGMVPGSTVSPQGRIIKLDAQDSVQWSLVFVDSNSTNGIRPQSAIELANGDFLVLGKIYYNYGFLCRITNTGTILWNKKISGGLSCKDIDIVANDKVVVTGQSQPFGWDPTTTIAEFDTAGNFIRAMAYGSQQFDYGNIVHYNAGTGGYTLIGYSQAVFSSGMDGACFIQTDASLSAGCHSYPMTFTTLPSATYQIMNPQMARVPVAAVTTIPYQHTIVALTPEVVCTPCIANAGQNQYTCSSSATLSGNQPNGVSGTWSQINGPVSASIQNPSSPTTAVTGMTQGGVYNFVWELNDPSCPQPKDTVSINVVPVTKPFIGNDTTVCAGTSFLMGSQSIIPIGSTIRWTPTTFLSDSTVAHPTFSGTVPSGSPLTLSYIMTVSSGINCYATDTMQVTVNPAESVAIVQQVNPSCSNLANGVLEVTFVNGVLPVQYQWANGQSGSQIAGLQGGNYQVTAIDANGCVAKGNFNLTSPPGISAQIKGFAPACNQNNGWLRVTSLLNATMPVSYLWNTGANTDSIGGLSPGFYQVVIQDSNGCTLTWDTTLTMITPFAVQANIKEVSCPGSSDGQIVLTISQGLPPYQVQWTNGAFGTNLSNLPPNTYSCNISDASGCSVFRQFTLATPPNIDTTFSQIIPPTCFGEATGSIRLGIVVGTRSFTVSWNDGQTGLTRQNIVSGTYLATVVDSFGCQKQYTFVVPDGAKLSYTTTISEISCENTHDGSISILPQGGTPPYSFFWSNGSTQSTVTNLIPGTYVVRITESGGCSKQDSFVLMAPQPLLANPQLVPEHCYLGATNGSIRLNPTGSRPPLRVSWNDGDTTQLRNNLSSGWYRFTLTNSVGCQAIDSVFVPFLPPPAPRFLTTPNLPAQIVYGQHVTMAVLNPQVGTTYRWTIGTTVISGANITFQAERTGNYDVTVEAIDSLGCRAFFSVGNISVQAEHHVYVPTGFTPNGDLINDTWTVVATGSKQIELKLFNRWGMLVFQSSESENNLLWDGKFNGEDAPEGVYVWYYESIGVDNSIKIDTGTLTLTR